MSDTADMDQFVEPPLDYPIELAIARPATNTVVVRVAGDLDLMTATVFHDQVWPVLGENGATVVLDLSGVGFLGSAGLAELVGANDRTALSGGRLVLVASSRTVLRPLEITGLNALFRIEESLDSALA